MKAEIIQDTEDHITEAAVAGSATKFVPAGSVLMVMRSGILRHTFPVAVNEDRVTVNQDLRALIPAEGISPRYVAHYLRGIQRQVLDRCSKDGTTVQSIEVSALERIRVPIAPAAQQPRIVARIDELFAEIAEGEAALERARQGLDTWRRALLKAAVTGELTRDWREANRPTETGADLLARIRAEHGSSGQKILRRRKSAEAVPLDIAALLLLPEGWVWARLSDLGEVIGGVTVDKKRKPVDPIEVPYLRVANVQRGYLDLSEVKTIRVERSVANKLGLKSNDILFNEGGDRDKIGRGWVWQAELPVCIHQNHVFRVRPHREGINPFFVSYYANEIGRTFFIEKGTQTTNLASISLSKIS
jgi:type I restriction enzyme, S subunit